MDYAGIWNYVDGSLYDIERTGVCLLISRHMGHSAWTAVAVGSLHATTASWTRLRRVIWRIACQI